MSAQNLSTQTQEIRDPYGNGYRHTLDSRGRVILHEIYSPAGRLLHCKVFHHREDGSREIQHMNERGAPTRVEWVDATGHVTTQKIHRYDSVGQLLNSYRVKSSRPNGAAKYRKLKLPPPPPSFGVVEPEAFSGPSRRLVH